MATSGSVDSSGYQGRVINFSWQLSGNKINYSFSAVGGSSSYYYHHNEQFYVNEQLVYEGPTSVAREEGEIYSGSIDVTSYLIVEMHGGISTYSDNIETMADWGVDAYANFTSLKVQSKTVNSATFSFTTDRAADLYVKNLTDGTNWLNNGSPFVTNKTSGTFTVYYADRANTTRLTPNKYYQFEVLCRAHDTTLDTSATRELTTYQIAQVSAANNFNHGDSDSITITNPSSATMSLTMKIGSTTILTKTPSTGSNTISFTQDQLDAIYKLYGTASSLTVTYTVSITVNSKSYTHSKTCTITLKGNQKTMRTNVSGSWKRGIIWTNVSGTWRRAVIWTNVNGTWRRGI